ncbi:uncharacterized protein EDB93DRAFT_1328229 [Suillus bovinus]|uniref:uncharacterized protein n=1 Tax=Suillus bovinus TaxID=48563 RepID=UPI001B872152|nr:uncharacterized protein EDB93DRAFT_1328229 [Suillus bovinus]KAG2149148.1 hypothetical protein EDB93DRAFT_1328229 [Suillus bovinus]
MSPAGGTGTSSTLPCANGTVEGDSQFEFIPNSRGASVVSENISLVGVTSEALAKQYDNFQDGTVAKIFLGESDRTSESEILKKVEEIAGRHATVQGRVLEFLWHHTFANPASAVREALGVVKPTTGSRVLYILVFPKLKPITELHDNQLFDVWYQCILCHLALWKEGVYHRDVVVLLLSSIREWRNSKR